MPWRKLLAEEMAELLKVLSHPHRIRIIHELRNGPMDVNSLQAVLGISHARVSQYLSSLKQHRLVNERREGRHVYYSLQSEGIAAWLAEGTQYLNIGAQHQAEIERALKQSSAHWGENRNSKPNGHSQTNSKRETPGTDPEDLQ
jgi:DNA-binding transcriptional ArsR family regulator